MSKSSHPESPHIYKLTKLGKGTHKVFRCIKPICSHFIEPGLLPGREAECPVCHKTYLLTTIHKRVVLPHCPNCNTRKKHVPFIAAPVSVRTPEQLAADFKRKFGT